MIEQASIFKRLGILHPGRLILRFKVKGAQKTSLQNKKSEVFRKAGIIVDYLNALHDAAQGRIREKFAEFIPEDMPNSKKGRQELAKDIYSSIRDCTYPYLYIDQKSIQETLQWRIDDFRVYDRLLTERPYYSEIAEPNLRRQFLKKQIAFLLFNGYTIEAGASINPIPALYAIERGVFLQTGTKDHADFLRLTFPVPDVSQVEDSIIDGRSALNPEGLLSPDSFRRFSSYFWSNYFNELTVERLRNIAEMPGLPTWEKFKGDYKQDITKEGAKQTNLPVNNNKDEWSLTRSAPLCLYTATRTDFSLSRLQHYTATSPEEFQDHVLFTNYTRYLLRFAQIACSNIFDPVREGAKGTLTFSSKPLSGSSRPGRVIKSEDLANLSLSEAAAEQLRKLKLEEIPMESLEAELKEFFIDLERDLNCCQMPTLHFKAGRKFKSEDLSSEEPSQYSELAAAGAMPSTTIVNIGVGPSNAKNITDHLAVLRPLSWTMVGHCGGLRQRQRLGNFVVAGLIAREDGVLGDCLSPDIPIKCSEYVAQSQVNAVFDDYHRKGLFTEDSESDGDLKGLKQRIRRIKVDLREGTVFTTSDRNWETEDADVYRHRFHQSRSVAVDMETGTLAANAYRHQIHFGALLCVSDKPWHGSVKMRYFADDFYKKEVSNHLKLCLDSVLFMLIDANTKYLLRNSRQLHPPENPPIS